MSHPLLFLVGAFGLLMTTFLSFSVVEGAGIDNVRPAVLRAFAAGIAIGAILFVVGL